MIKDMANQYIPNLADACFDGTIVVAIRSQKGISLEYDPMCALLNQQEHLNKDTDLLYYNSTIKDEFGIFTTEDKSVRGPICLNDGDEMQFWKEDYFDFEYFIINLCSVPPIVKYIDFLLFDYNRYTGASEDVCTWDWRECELAFYKLDDTRDVLGKHTLVSEKPTFIDISASKAKISSIKDYPHCRSGRLQRMDMGWKYIPIWDGIKDLEDYINNY